MHGCNKLDVNSWLVYSKLTNRTEVHKYIDIDEEYYKKNTIRRIL